MVPGAMFRGKRMRWPQEGWLECERLCQVTASSPARNPGGYMTIMPTLMDMSFPTWDSWMMDQQIILTSRFTDQRRHVAAHLPVRAMLHLPLAQISAPVGTFLRWWGLQATPRIWIVSEATWHRVKGRGCTHAWRPDPPSPLASCVTWARHFASLFPHLWPRGQELHACAAATG